MKLAVNVELGSSNVIGNIPKALNQFAKVIVCSDDKAVLERISKTGAQNVLCALVQDVPTLVGKMRFNEDTTFI
jgi:hypothetical protein